MKPVFNKNSKTAVLFAALLFLILTPLLFTNCTALILNPGNPSEPAVEDEKTPEEIEREQEEERQRLEEEIRLEEERFLEERRLREEALKEELGQFYVPLPPLEQEENPPVQAKGIYMTGNMAGLERRFHELLDMIDATELNAVVMDVKNDHGLMSYNSAIEIVQDVRGNRSTPIKDIEAVMAQLKERDVYPIARIVVFRDPNLPEHRPEWAIQRNTGGVWRDNKNYGWVNPYNKNVWDYNIAIAKEAALMGFREIQFDYVRFPENARRVDREANYPGQNGMAKDEAIEAFLTYAREQLEEYNVHIAADTFGVIATSWGDSDQIGQTWEKVAPLVEIHSPMVYPSHYGAGYFGLSVPDANPAETIRRAMTDAVKRNAPIENPGTIRPWLQSFTASWVRGNIRYGAVEVRAQIDAALELGIDEFLIWNAGNKYIIESFLPAEEARLREEKIRQERKEKGLDVLSKTTEESLEDYLEAVSRRRWRDALVLQATDFSMDHVEFKSWFDSWENRLSEYEVKSSSTTGNKTVYQVDLTFTVKGEALELKNQAFEVYEENSIWRVKPSQEFIDMLTFVPENIDEDELE